MRKLLFLLSVAACGDSARPAQPDAPEAPIDAAIDPVTPGCTQVPQTSNDMFSKPEDFGDLTPGTLAGWNPDGRWFLTGTRVGGVSSFHFQKRASDIVVDRDTMFPGTIDDDKMFQRSTYGNGQGGLIIIAKRVSNRLGDGSLRADRAACDGDVCRVCTAKMIRAERHDAAVGDKLSLVGSLNSATWGRGFTFNVRVVGNLAYLIRQDGLHIIDVTDPANPVERGAYQRTGDGYSNDVKIVDAAAGKRYAIIADFPCDVVDVTNPDAPVLAAQLPEEAHTLFTETRNGTTYAYLGNYDGTTPVFDVTNPAAPVRLGRYNSEASVVHDLSVKDGIAYLNAWEGGMHVVDFTNPAMPKRLGVFTPTPTMTSHSNWTTTIGTRHIALHGEEAYGAHLDVVDLDPASATYMKSLASYKTRDWVSIHNIMAFGSKGYFTYYQDGVRVMDLSDPAAPKLLGYYNTWDPQADDTSSAFFEGAVGLDVDPVRKLIFVADSPRGLLILRDDT